MHLSFDARARWRQVLSHAIIGLSGDDNAKIRELTNMNPNLSGRRSLEVILALTTGAFIVWMVILLLLWLALRTLGYSTSFWVMVGALSAALPSAAVVGAGFLAMRELSEVATSRHMDVADRLFQELNSPENIEARRWVFTQLPADPEQGMKTITPAGQAAVKQVLNSLDHVAFLTQAGWIPDEVIMPWMHPMIFKTWEKLEPYVKYERQRRNEPYYYAYAGRLAERCKAWRERNLADTNATWITGAL
jgi:uncharacterized protein DUF4760